MIIIQEFKTEHLPFVGGMYRTSNFLLGSVSILVAGCGFDHFGNELILKFATGMALLAIPGAIYIKKRKPFQDY